MNIKKASHKQATVDMCDKLIEDAQTALMNQTEPTNEITLNLSDYTVISADDEEAKINNQEIIDYLLSQEIRLYEDESDEDGLIINSKEFYSCIFKNITLEVSTNNTLINLFFSQGLMDLLT